MLGQTCLPSAELTEQSRRILKAPSSSCHCGGCLYSNPEADLLQFCEALSLQQLVVYIRHLVAPSNFFSLLLPGSSGSPGSQQLTHMVCQGVL